VLRVFAKGKQPTHISYKVLETWLGNGIPVKLSAPVPRPRFFFLRPARGRWGGGIRPMMIPNASLVIFSWEGVWEMHTCLLLERPTATRPSSRCLGRSRGFPTGAPCSPLAPFSVPSTHPPRSSGQQRAVRAMLGRHVEVQVEIQVVPNQNGQNGSVLRMTWAAAATIVTDKLHASWKREEEDL
jgi:hypothetical protein